ncbi:MAG TPA: MBL fold metallo-hydrolase [Xanthobacteraceae bacterium]|jgi:glyoxylase-like metal-dependent hydrolase (beta-lactamase superfamily II)
MLKTTMAMVFALTSCASALSQEAPRNAGGGTERNASGSLRQIIPGYYAYTSGSFNSGVIATSDGVVVLDALNSAAVGRAERQAIANTTEAPVRVLVSSTFHNNYSKGNVAYADVWKIGHENYRTDLLALMQREKVSAEEQKARLPNQTYQDRVTLYFGGKEIQVLYMGRAHTRGDSIIYVPQDRIAYLSELFFADQFPYIDDGYGLDWLKALDAVQALGAQIYVPAHGPITSDPRESQESLHRARQILVDIRDAVQQAIAHGATEEQALATVQWPQYEKLRGYSAQREVAVRRLYRQLSGSLN